MQTAGGRRQIAERTCQYHLLLLLSLWERLGEGAKLSGWVIRFTQRRYGTQRNPKRRRSRRTPMRPWCPRSPHSNTREGECATTLFAKRTAVLGLSSC
jgi:hypothetical protein